MAGKEYRNMGKTECEEAGKVWVEAHMRSMTYVHSYCRDRTKEEIEKMSNAEKKEFEKKSPNLKGHYEGKGRDPLDAISEIVNNMDLPYNGGGDEIEYELPNGKDTMSEDEVKEAGSASFSTSVYKNGRTYDLSGYVSKKGGKWVAGAEVEEVDF
jgi:hypothetical protein